MDSTLHLTQAMGLVASSKIRRATDAMLKGRDFSTAVEEMVLLLSNCAECQKSPYMRIAEGNRTVLIVIAGDRGLCGGYNANIFRLMRDYPEASVIPIGKRAYERYGGEFVSSETYSREAGFALATRLCKEFTDNTFDRLGIVSSQYVSVMTQEAKVEWILPLKRTESGRSGNILFEPNEMDVLSSAIPEYVSGKILAAVRESFACEVAARRMAMDSAGKNAQQMISDLQLQYNRARQGAITQEITEIVAGSGG